MEESFLPSSNTLEITNFETDLTEKLVKKLSCHSRFFKERDRDKRYAFVCIFGNMKNKYMGKKWEVTRGVLFTWGYSPRVIYQKGTLLISTLMDIKFTDCIYMSMLNYL